MSLRLIASFGIYMQGIFKLVVLVQTPLRILDLCIQLPPPPPSPPPPFPVGFKTFQLQHICNGRLPLFLDPPLFNIPFPILGSLPSLGERKFLVLILPDVRASSS